MTQFVVIVLMYYRIWIDIDSIIIAKLYTHIFCHYCSLILHNNFPLIFLNKIIIIRLDICGQSQFQDFSKFQERILGKKNWESFRGIDDFINLQNTEKKIRILNAGNIHFVVKKKKN